MIRRPPRSTRTDTLFPYTTLFRSLAHITGGGLLENIPRVLPKGAHARIDAAAWPQLPLMAFLRQQGDITPDEMARTFNCGIGMAVLVTETEVAAVTNALTTANETVHRIGSLDKGTHGCNVEGPAGSGGHTDDESAADK